MIFYPETFDFRFRKAALEQREATLKRFVEAIKAKVPLAIQSAGIDGVPQTDLLKQVRNCVTNEKGLEVFFFIATGDGKYRAHPNASQIVANAGGHEAIKELLRDPLVGGRRVRRRRGAR